MKVLLVDDEIVALNALKKRVDWNRYGVDEIFTAQTIMDAQEILNKQKIDIMLCDIELQVESGLSLAGFAWKQYRDLWTVIVTCHDEAHYIKAAKACGVKGYLLKPLDYQELEEILEEREKEREKAVFAKTSAKKCV